MRVSNSAVTASAAARSGRVVPGVHALLVENILRNRLTVRMTALHVLEVDLVIGHTDNSPNHGRNAAECS